MNTESSLKHTKFALDQVSSSICLAKWSQVTLHLESGTNHSCHHPLVHSTPLKELKKNKEALHNTKYKVKTRRQMLSGERPAECSYCWKVEDLNRPEIYSDRIWKSSTDWSLSQKDKILADPLNPKHRPSYLEVSFSNVCNLKCSYCSANFSTSWANELKELGPYSTKTGALTSSIFKEENNPYIQAFWEWWPELSQDLQVLRITGGEPLLSPNTFKVLEKIKANPLPSLKLAINTNLSVPLSRVQKLAEEINILQKNKSVQCVDIYTSLESVGERAEYIRFGLNYKQFSENLRYLLTHCPQLKISFMSSLNLLSVTSFLDFLKMILEINKELSSELRPKAITVDTYFLKDPMYQSISLLPLKFEKYFSEIYAFLKANKRSDSELPYGFEDFEISRFERAYEIFMAPKNRRLRKDLQCQVYMFFSEHDERRKTNFEKTFPELFEFWDECRKLMPLMGRTYRLRRALFNIQILRRKFYQSAWSKSD